jgi:hypothetical protein
MGVSFDEASAIADDCVRREWIEHVVLVHTVRPLEEGRRVASRGEKDDHREGNPARLPRACVILLHTSPVPVLIP